MATVYHIAQAYFARDFIFGWMFSAESDMSKPVSLANQSTEFLTGLRGYCNPILHDDLINGINTILSNKKTTDRMFVTPEDEQGTAPETNTQVSPNNTETFKDRDEAQLRPEDASKLLDHIFTLFDPCADPSHMVIDLSYCKIIYSRTEKVYTLSYGTTVTPFTKFKDIVNEILRKFW